MRTTYIPVANRRRPGPPLAAFLALIAAIVPGARAAPPPPAGGPSVRAAMRQPVDLARLADADHAIHAAIARGDVPGAVLLVGRGDDVVYRKAYGACAVQPTRVAMTVDTVFDLASLTKPVACATAVMVLVDRGKVRLDAPVASYLPEFGQNGKGAITVEQLLVHWSGLIPDNAMADYADGPAAALRNVYALRPKWEPGTRFAYSDVGYIVLGELVRKMDGRPLDAFVRDEVFRPLGMAETTYLPPDALRKRAAPTQQRGGQWMVGEVHDPRAFALGGVAGHAGLFGTADDLARWCRMILGRGTVDGTTRVLGEATVREMTRPRRLPDGTGCRALGFDVDTPYSSCRGERFAAGSTFGHTGFTGTMLWIDPANDCYVILLTNAVHPDGKGRSVGLRKQVATIVGEALLGPARATSTPAATRPTTRLATQPATRPAEPAPVLCGIDVLARDGFRALEGRRVALVTNHTGLDRTGRRTVDVLAGAKNLKLVKLFSPEHGLWGQVDEKVPDAVDPPTGLRVYSLYGATRKPSAEMLADVDTIVFDVQDVGARYYTYVSTLGLCMEAAAEHKRRVVVLDRPCPVTGLLVDGPVPDAAALDFVAYAPVPVAHGMTVGEMARYLNAERGIGCDLTVVPVENWRRRQWWDETGLMWVNPSPNLRNPTQALLYLALGQLEFANLSVGRGTDQPFEQFGAPWVDGRRLAAALNGAALPGLRFTPVAFTPASSKFAGQRCEGAYVAVTDRDAAEPVRAGLAIAWHLRSLFGDRFDTAGVAKMTKNAEVTKALEAADDPARLAEAWQKPLAEFQQVRRKYLAYE